MNECDPTVRKRRSWFSSLTSTSSYSLSSSVSLTPSPSSQMITNMSDSQVDLDSVYGSMASSSSSSHVAGNFSDSAISQDPDAVYGFIATSSSDSEPRSRTKAVTSTKGNKTSQTNIPVVDSEMECKMATFIEEDLRYHPLTFSNPLRNKSLLTDSHPALATESVVVPVGQPVDSVLSSIPSTNGPAPSLWQRATSLRRSLGKSSRQPLKSNKNKERKHPSNSIITMIRSLESAPQPTSTSTGIVHSTNVQMPKRQVVVSGFSRHFNEPSNASSTASSAMSSSSNSTSGSSLSLSSSRAARGSYSSCASSSSLSPRTLDNATAACSYSARYIQRPQSSQPLITSSNGNKVNKNIARGGGGILKNGSGSTIAVPVIISREENDSPSPPPLPPRSFNFSKSAPQLAANTGSSNSQTRQFDNNMNKRPPPPLPKSLMPGNMKGSKTSSQNINHRRNIDNNDLQDLEINNGNGTINSSSQPVVSSILSSTSSSCIPKHLIENVDQQVTGIKYQAVALKHLPSDQRYCRPLLHESQSSISEMLEPESDPERPSTPKLPSPSDLDEISDMEEIGKEYCNLDVDLPLPPPPSPGTNGSAFDESSQNVFRSLNGNRHRSHHLPSSSSSASSCSSAILSNSSPISRTSLLSPAEELLKKSDQVNNLSQVLDNLRMEEVSSQRDFESNESLGSQLLNKLCAYGLSSAENDKITTHFEEIEKVTRLLLSLSARLRDVEMTLQSKSLRTSQHLQQQQQQFRRSSSNFSRSSDSLKSPGTSMPVILTTLTDYDIEDALKLDTQHHDDQDSLIDSPTSSTIKLPDNLNDYPEIQLLVEVNADTGIDLLEN